jgi:hypothetical protein
MKVLNQDQLFERGLLNYSKADYFSKNGSRTEFTNLRRVRIPSDTSRLPHFADFLIKYLDDSAAINSVFLLGASDIWSPDIDELGQHLYRKITGTTDVPYAVVFESGDDKKDLIGIIFVVLSFQWDAIFFPDKGDFCLSICHDGCLELRCKTLEELNRYYLKLEQWLDG